MKSSQGLVKFVIGCWIRPGTTSVYTKEKWCSDRKKQGPMTKKYRSNKLLMNFFGERKMKTEEDERMIKLDFFQNCPFWTYIKNINTFTFCVHGHSSWPTLSLHLVKGPKTLEIIIFREIRPWKLDHQVGPWKKRPSSMVRLHGSWCKRDP